ncbi:hypothetical protein ACFRAO_30295 [Streptomyces sp. NPDC056656]|uniref:hypothetical protein n=1 Tax=Streptomyces sp. NPDC056656 TaxID=3345895 RepID=UPI0036AE2497
MSGGRQVAASRCVDEFALLRRTGCASAYPFRPVHGGRAARLPFSEDANALGQPRPGTDIYIDAAGAAAVFNTVVASAKCKAKLVMVAVQKKSDAIDLGGMLRSELTLIASQGYPTEIFEVTGELAEHQDRFARLISNRVPFTDVERAYELALTPGAAEKVVVTFD